MMSLHIDEKRELICRMNSLDHFLNAYALNLNIPFFQRVGGHKPLNVQFLRNSLASFGYFCPAHPLGQSKWAKG
jgi:hypothetical protein